MRWSVDKGSPDLRKIKADKIVLANKSKGNESSKWASQSVLGNSGFWAWEIVEEAREEGWKKRRLKLK